MTKRSLFVALGGGVDGTSPETQVSPGRLRTGVNIEAKPGGGYQRMEGYTAFDDEITGSGPIRGIHYFNGKLYAFRNDSAGTSCQMWSSTGSGWTLIKSGLTADGTYRMITSDMDGSPAMYGASGTHKAFKFDGSTWTDITTGMAADVPSHIAAHKQHLFLSFANSVQHSSIGNSSSWTPVTGAGELLVSENVTGFSVMPNGSLGVFTRSGITLLAGTSSSDWVANNMVEYGNNAGAIAGTIQSMGAAVRFCDSRGIIDFAASDTSSDFYDAIISHDMDRAIQGLWGRAISATVVRAKNQYRLFFNDGSGVILTFAANRVMITQIQFPHVVHCVTNTEDSSGNERIYFGADNGIVYQMESGRSFGGQAISAYAETAFTDMGDPHHVKRFRRLWVDLGRNGGESLNVSATCLIDNDGDSNQSLGGFDIERGGTPLGIGRLGAMVLGTQPVADGRINLSGTAKYISLKFSSSTTDSAAWEINGITIDYFMGRKRR
ncbi:hypothetical protein [Marinobacterium litorale]|uniref:hypothetical protein n=1 Tax=Marinobacterium litorale TaxID=404770 RepID=UPI0003F861BF|nr:hypothetical protein [Marinobacterium litorale]